MSQPRALIVSTLVALAFACGVAQAQTARSGGGNNAQLMMQLQQLASERTSLQAENAKMKKELDDVRKERDALKKAQQSADQRAQAQSSAAAALARSESQRATLEQELKQTQERTQELIAKFRETAQTLREVESDRTAAKQTLVSREQELKLCTDRNAELYKLNGEVLTRLEHQSAWSRVAEKEPFTKLTRVRLENLVDDYKTRAEDQRFAPAAAAAAPGNATANTSPATPSP